MDRRRFLLTSLAGAVTAPLAAGAQPGARPATIGVLVTTGLTEALQKAVREGLEEQGFVEGRNIVIEWRSADTRPDRAAALATDLVHRKVDVIVAALTSAVYAAKNATSTIPIVMAPAGDPVGSRFIASLARPGGNITGVTGIADALAGKHLEALRHMIPRLTRLALLINPVSETFSKSLTEQTQGAAKTSAIQLHVVTVRRAEQLEGAFAKIAQQRDKGVIVQGVFNTLFGRIAQFSLRYGLPSISAPREFAEAGGLLAYGVSQVELARRAMSYVARILRGAKPADLPVEQPTMFELIINLRTANALGLTISPSLLARADQVIE